MLLKLADCAKYNFREVEVICNQAKNVLTIDTKYNKVITKFNTLVFQMG